MKIITFLALFTSLIVSFTDAESEPIRCYNKGCEGLLPFYSFAYTKPNMDELVGSKSILVTYPGLPYNGENVKIKIFRNGQRYAPVHVLHIHEDIGKEQIFHLALDNVVRDTYHAQLCAKYSYFAEEECSPLSYPGTEMEMGDNCDGQYHQLKCTRKLRNGVKKHISADLAPVAGLADGYAKKIDNDFDGFKKEYNITGNQQLFISGGRKMIYFAVNYPLKNFRELLRKDDICQRLFTPIIMSYLIDDKNKTVKAFGKVTPYLPPSFYEKFLGIDLSQIDATTGEYKYTDKKFDEIRLVPVRLMIDVTDYAIDLNKDYTMWHMACAVRKDGGTPGITRCAAPFVHPLNIYIPVTPRDSGASGASQK